MLAVFYGIINALYDLINAIRHFILLPSFSRRRKRKMQTLSMDYVRANIKEKGILSEQ